MGFRALCNTVLLGTTLVACTTFPGSTIEPFPFPEGIHWEAQPKPKTGVWTSMVSGIATDLALTRDGSAALIATIPDPEREGPHDYRLVRYRRTLNGASLRYQVQWSKSFKNKVRALDLSEDGRFAVMNNYSDELIAFAASGKQIWKVRGSCRPKILAEAKLVVCFHDDDADPDTAFTLFSLNRGEKVAQFPAPGDVLGLKTSPDQKWIAIALSGSRAAATLTRSRVALYDVARRDSVWEQEMEGEFLDFAISPVGSDRTDMPPSVAVLTAAYGSKAKPGASRKSRLRIWDRLGKRDQDIEFPAESIEFSSHGEGVYIYGNAPTGQSLAFLEIGKPAPRWHRGIPNQADFAGSLLSTPEGVISSFEEIENGTRKIRWIEVRSDGKILARRDLPITEGAYLYVMGLSSDGLTAWFLSDNGLIGAFKRSVGF
ncbi:MAG: hypothetical protein JNL01_04975 [Bdellovibrionales bacterium]|nr:hypothetical protein [Bdellovibrionales bacterium]